MRSPDKLDDSIREMIEYPGPVIFDCLVEKHENCFPMIPSGKAHNEMILGNTPRKIVYQTMARCWFSKYRKSLENVFKIEKRG